MIRLFWMILSISILLLSCYKDDDCNFDNPGSICTTDINASFIHLVDSSLAGNIFLNYDSAGIKIKATTVRCAFNNNNKNWFIFPTAMACSPVIPGPKYHGNFNISATDTTYFNNEVLLPGVSLNEYFLPLDSDQITDLSQQYGFDSWPYSLIIRLKEKPDQPVQSTIEVEFLQTNGEIFKSATAVNIK